eukprot:TRINITY_DN213_c0_g1_i7.p1 TRINITY_DN213_c0_g1~~TRINITY_DN213_c0_g1_i7.p1  ORF type:complete len:415 (-),score=54.56 TRINITY_DN213_c0_g1_i7:156-1400(-)
MCIRDRWYQRRVHGDNHSFSRDRKIYSIMSDSKGPIPFSFQVILEDVIVASLRVIIISALGVYVYRLKVIRKDTIKALSMLAENIFLPCLLFSNIVKTLDLTNVSFWLPMTLMCLANCFFGLLFGMVYNQYKGIKGGVIYYMNMLSYAFPHTTNIQLTLMLSLPSSFRLIGSKEGPNNSIYDRGVTYISITSLIYMLLRYSVGRRYLLKARAEVQLEKEQSQRLIVETTQATETEQKPEEPWYQKIQEYLNPPLYSGILSIIFCSVPFLKSFTLSEGFMRDAAFYTLEQTGKNLTVFALAALGCMLAAQFEERKAKVHWRAVIEVNVFRLIIFPILGGIFIMFLKAFHLEEDPVSLYVSLMLFSTPVATNIANQAQNIGFKSDEFLQILAFGYIFCVITLPATSIIFFNLMSPS